MIVFSSHTHTCISLSCYFLIQTHRQPIWICSAGRAGDKPSDLNLCSYMTKLWLRAAAAAHATKMAAVDEEWSFESARASTAKPFGRFFQGPKTKDPFPVAVSPFSLPFVTLFVMRFSVGKIHCSFPDPTSFRGL